MYCVTNTRICSHSKPPGIAKDPASPRLRVAQKIRMIRRSGGVGRRMPASGPLPTDAPSHRPWTFHRYHTSHTHTPTHAETTWHGASQAERPLFTLFTAARSAYRSIAYTPTRPWRCAYISEFRALLAARGWMQAWVTAQWPPWPTARAVCPPLVSWCLLVPVTNIGHKTIMMTLLAVDGGEGKLFISGLVYDQNLLGKRIGHLHNYKQPVWEYTPSVTPRMDIINTLK